MSESPTANLVEAAIGCLIDYGVAKTSLTDVARRGGVSRTTAYRIFGSKQGMLAAVARDQVASYLAALDRSLADSDSPADAMRAGVTFSLSYLNEHALLQRLFRNEPEELIDLIVERAGSPEVITLLTEATGEILTKWVEPDQLRVTVEEAAEWVVRAVYSFLLIPTTRISEPDRIAALLLSGISVPSRADATSPGLRDT